MPSTDYSAVIELPPYKLRDRWPITPDGTGGIHFGPIRQQLPDGTLIPMPVPMERVVWTFRTGSPASPPYIIDSEENSARRAPVEILSAADWEFVIPVIQNFLPTGGIWSFDCAVYIPGSSSPHTIYAGTITPIRDV